MNNERGGTSIVVGGAIKEKVNEMKRFSLPVILAMIISPLVIAGVYLSVREFKHQTSIAFERREAIVSLGALLIKEKFDGIVDVGMSLASRPMVYQNIEKGNWSKSIENIDGIQQYLPYIDAINLFDKEGVMKARIPSAPETIGKSFAYRDYYQGVSKEWKPYVSAAFLRVPEPRYNVVTVAIPIRSSNQNVLGFLLLAIKADEVVNWSNELNVGSHGYIIVVDKKGQLVGHLKMNGGDELIDFSSVAVVKKLLNGEHGVDVFFDTVDNEEDLAAYASVEKYGYGVMVVQPKDIAFAGRNQEVVKIALILALIIVIVGFSSYRILKNKAMMQGQRDRERLFLDSIGDGVVAIDRNWNITLWNRMAGVISGWSNEEALGKPFRSIIKFLKEPEREEHFSFIEEAIVSGNVQSVKKGLLLVRKDGSEIAIADSAASVVNGRGQSEGAIIVFRDISKGLASDRMHSDFSYATHQLRTPVTEALWNIETAQKTHNVKKRNENLEFAHDAILSVKDLEEHLITVSEIDRGVVVPHIVSVKINDALGDLKEKLHPKAKLRKVTLSVEMTPVSLEVNTDPKLLKGVLYEIMDNAILYGHEGTIVNVQTSLQDGNIIFEIGDHGRGISTEDQPIIFTKFFRGSNHGTKIAGSGLGLFVAKEYVKLLGGKIWFNSEEGEGTTFFVSIPVR
ncbi:MAG: PAS domain S-box protein [Candidatus Yonathbacteria bacterium]|nr:PAS domain S-box protein [Candidatus Yonathbacteria bacterium]